MGFIIKVKIQKKVLMQTTMNVKLRNESFLQKENFHISK